MKVKKDGKTEFLPLLVVLFRLIVAAVAIESESNLLHLLKTVSKSLNCSI